jgi:hypothetical protein
VGRISIAKLCVENRQAFAPSLRGGIGFYFLSPLAWGEAKSAFKQKVEQTDGLKSAFQGDIDDLAAGGSQEFLRTLQPNLTLLFPEGHADYFVKDTASVPRRAMHVLNQLVQGQIEQSGGGHLFQQLDHAHAGIRFGLGDRIPIFAGNFQIATNRLPENLQQLQTGREWIYFWI